MSSTNLYEKQVQDGLVAGGGARSATQPKRYVALLSQTGTDAPAATVLENTLGAVVWSRQGAGNYRGTLAGAFAVNKVFGLAGGINDGSVEVYAVERLSDDIVIVQNPTGDENNISIEITVYP